MYDQATAARSDSEAIRCPRCGGLNRAGAQWCGQCLERFVPPKPLEIPGGAAEGGPPPPPPPPNLSAELEAPVTPSVSGATGTSAAFSVGADGIAWACKQCDTANSFEEEVCSVCGMSFADLLRPPAPERTAREPNQVALISLFWPGAGHAYLGQWGQAVARGVVSLWVLFVTITATAQGGLGAMSLLFGTIAFGLWVVAAHDAYREASGESDRIILKQGYFLWVVLGILVLMMALFVVQGLQAGAAA